MYLQLGSPAWCGHCAWGGPLFIPVLFLRPHRSHHAGYRLRQFVVFKQLRKSKLCNLPRKVHVPGTYELPNFTRTTTLEEVETSEELSTSSLSRREKRSPPRLRLQQRSSSFTQASCTWSLRSLRPSESSWILCWMLRLRMVHFSASWRNAPRRMVSFTSRVRSIIAGEGSVMKQYHELHNVLNAILLISPTSKYTVSHTFT